MDTTGNQNTPDNSNNPKRSAANSDSPNQQENHNNESADSAAQLRASLFSNDQQPDEITLKSVLISIVIAALLAASNAYLALKLGQTVSASIPAAVLAMGILRFFKKHSILECNIIQTGASAGEGVAAAMAFVLPAMVILHFWQGFPYWQTTIITLLGGTLGVLFSVPLRRVFLGLKYLRFPEGTAVGHVLLASASGRGALGLLGLGGLAGAVISFCQTGLKVMAESMALWFGAGSTVFGMSLGFSPALLSAGFIVGFEVGASICLGLVIAWVILIPALGYWYGLLPASDPVDQAMALWKDHLRYVGVGVMLVGGIWTLLNLLKPIAQGLKLSFQTLGKSTQKDSESSFSLPRVERDIPTKWVLIGIFVIMTLVYLMLATVIDDLHFDLDPTFILFLKIISIVLVFVVGFLLSAMCGYFSGLIGSSNNPLSGLLLISILTMASVYLLVFYFFHDSVVLVTQTYKVSALVLVVTAVLSAAASVSNENLQDLKAGYMVGSTPYKQQLMLIVGVVVSAFCIAPVLQLLYQAYGIGGVMPRPNMDASQMLMAPQASLMATVADGVLTHHLQWSMLILGGMIAGGLIFLDLFLRRAYDFRLPILAVGLGIYLPPQVTTGLIAGGLLNKLVTTRLAKRFSDPAARQHQLDRVVMLACGLVAGSSLMGVFLAVPFVLAGNSDALAIVGPNFAMKAGILGAVCSLAILFWLYNTSMRVKKD